MADQRYEARLDPDGKLAWWLMPAPDGEYGPCWVGSDGFLRLHAGPGFASWPAGTVVTVTPPPDAADGGRQIGDSRPVHAYSDVAEVVVAVEFG